MPRVLSFPRITASLETISRKTINRDLGTVSSTTSRTVWQKAESVMSAMGERATIGRGRLLQSSFMPQLWLKNDGLSMRNGQGMIGVILIYLCMKMNSTHSMVLLGVVVFLILIGIAVGKQYMPSEHDAVAQCLTEQGVEMYGAYWCPNCIDQKERFGSAWRHIDYVECSSQGSKTFDLCPDLEAVPLWTDGTVEMTGNRSVGDLAETYGCEDVE